MKPKKKAQIIPDYLRIPYQLVKDKTITPTDKFVYGSIYLFSTMGGAKCIASNTTIAKMACVAVTSIPNSLTRLEERGYIKRLFFDDNKKKKRAEIIPLVVVTKVPWQDRLAEIEVLKHSSNNEWATPKSIRQITNGHSSNNEWSQSTDLPHKNEQEASVEPFSGEKDEKKHSSNNEQIYIYKDNIYKDKQKSPIGQDNLGKPVQKTETINQLAGKDPINNAIALFLTIVPGDFIDGRSAFQKPPTRKAVEMVLTRHTQASLQQLIDDYKSYEGDQYRPSVGTVFEFCGPKLAKIESFLATKKKAQVGQLYANRPISSKEYREKWDAAIHEKMEVQRAKQRQDKLEWEKEQLAKKQKEQNGQ